MAKKIYLADDEQDIRDVISARIPLIIPAAHSIIAEGENAAAINDAILGNDAGIYGSVRLIVGE